MAELFATAFVSDPFFRWLYPGDDYGDRAREYFFLVCERLWPRAEAYLLEGAAASLWVPPGRPVAEDADLVALAALLEHQLGDRAGQVLAAIGSTAPYVPGDAHATCVYVAVRADRRGEGLGGRLMAPTLAAYDRLGTGTYLTSTNELSLSFYERLGFTALAELRAAPDGPTMRPMWRPRQNGAD